VRPIERAAYWTGGLLILSGVIHLAMLLTGGGTWEGPLSLRKPATFGLSFGLTLVNVTVIASFLPLKNRSRALLLGVFTAACVLETFLVSLQTWRGVPSHFNVETPLDAAIAQTLALGGFTLVAVIILLAVAVFRHGGIAASNESRDSSRIRGAGRRAGCRRCHDRHRHAPRVRWRSAGRLCDGRMAETGPRHPDARHPRAAATGVADGEKPLGRA
jgi:hypothetical protein